MADTITKTVRLPPDEAGNLVKMADQQEATESEIIRMALNYLWEDLGDAAEALAQARAAIARRAEEDK